MKPVIVENIDSVFTFGKHKNKSIKEVALTDPSYIEWLCKTVTSFNISTSLIDELSDYCLSIFFSDPELYLNEKGSFTLLSWQHLKYKDNEITIGGISLNERLMLLKQNNLPSTGRHISLQFSRKVFDGDQCKKNLNERVHDENIDDIGEYDDGDDGIDMEDIRRSYNDAYEIDSNEFDGWYEPID